jgi:hypothetical protein
MRVSNLLQNRLGDGRAGWNWFLFKQYSFWILFNKLVFFLRRVIDKTVCFLQFSIYLIQENKLI